MSFFCLKKTFREKVFLFGFFSANHAAIFAGPNSGQHLPERAIVRSVGQHLVADHVVHTRTSTSP